ncbi:MAG TPA: tetratricopeptide repeat protein [Actinomycetota bacterium]|nr:tetratricopeptide repeat protein [Actinomycetota bacterium]
MLTCPACGAENPEGSRFCNACGSALGRTEELRKERKFATALFADLVGSTALAEREDPEVVQSVVGRTFDRLAEEISRYEGLLEKFMGDAVLAVFGVPRAHEDDAERAVRAALEMQAVLSELNRGFADEGRPTLSMRIGIEAGEVLVDVERASGPRDRMLTGDAVNTAARLQTAAEPAQIVVGPAVYASTKDVIEYRELEPLTLKGKAESVPAWRALRIKARTRGERPRLGLEARLVGRDEELAVLKQTLRRVQTEGRPALVTVVGPAGVGKSRLVAELEHYVEGLPEIVYWRRGRCLAYGNTSYSAFADAIKAQCEIFEDDAAEVATKKADAAVRELFGDEAVAPQIRALVGAGEARAISREDLFDAWRRFLERLAARYPLVVVLDDLHWADDGLLDFVDHVADWAQGPILLLATARAELFETRPTWGGGKRNAASIYLDPLSAAEGEAMLDDLLPGPVAPALKRTIVERSEGNPLYVEEIVRKLIDDGVLRATEASRWEVAQPVADIELPRSVQGLIAARLDGLPEDEKAVLQDAAVIGRVFWVGAVAELTGRAIAEVRDALGRLRVKEIVVPHEPSSFSDELEFSFRHNLLRDGAYESLPKSLRADKHAGVARWAEHRAGDRADEIAELIATHLLEALRYLDELGETGERRDGLRRSALRWTQAAGSRTSALWLRSEATRWFRETERLADELDVPAAERVGMIRAHMDASWATDPITETERVLRRAIDIFTELDDPVGLGWAWAHLVIPMLLQSRDAEAEAAGRTAIEILEPLGESPELADALHRLGWYLWRRGRTEEAEPLARRAVEMSVRVDAKLVHAESMETLAVCLYQTGRTEEAIVAGEEAYRLAKEVGDFSALMRAYNNLPSVLLDAASDFRRGEEILHEGLEIAQRAGSLSHQGWLTGSLGDTNFRLGRLQEAEALQREAVELAVQVGDEPLRGMRMTALAAIVLARGRIEEAEAIHRESIPVLDANPEPQSQVFIPQVEGLLALARADDRGAAASFAELVEQLRGYNVEAVPEGFTDLVRVLVRIGRTEEAGSYRDLSDRGRSPAARANALLVEGLLSADPVESRRLLEEGATALEEIGLRIDAARAMIDLGRAMARAGEDPRPVLERARAILLQCDARAFLPEVDRAETELGR